jgi:hypothetical protein
MLFVVINDQAVLGFFFLAKRTSADAFDTVRGLLVPAGFKVLYDVELSLLADHDVIAAAIDGIAGFYYNRLRAARGASHSHAADDSLADKVAIVESVFFDHIVLGGFEILVG